jgi:hypothetical protein
VIPCDPTPWLMVQNGLPAVRARRMLGLHREDDAAFVLKQEKTLAAEQDADGSFGSSPLRTAGTLNLLDDLRATASAETIARGARYLFSVLQAQPGYERARDIQPGTLTTPCDLCGFFGPYEARGEPERMAHGADEMNALRAYEPLTGPQSPVRGERRSSRDRAGPSSCYAWGLIPLSYTIEALCRAGFAREERLQPALNALLGAQRESGGWCRNLGGHTGCSIHAIRALGAYPELRASSHAERALAFWRATQLGERGSALQRRWRGANLFAALQATAAFELPLAHDILRDALAEIAPRQRKNGTFGTPCRIERVAAVLEAVRALRKDVGAEG